MVSPVNPLYIRTGAPGNPKSNGEETVLLMWGYHDSNAEHPAGTWDHVDWNVNSFYSIVEWEELVDIDMDDVPDIADNCVNDYNPDQDNADDDSFGNACDTDDDNDGWEDFEDNCPLTYNPGQEDSLDNGVGDACRTCCYDYTGNTNCTQDEEPDISDIVYLINMIYYGGPICCFDEADVNLSGDLDIADIVKVIQFLFYSHQQLPDCPLRSE